MSARRSAALVRRWVGLYTLGLPAEIRDRRRDEIDDDLWCQAQDAVDSRRADRSLGGEILARLVFGMPADVSWRVDQRRLGGMARSTPERSFAMDTRLPAVLALVGGAMWAIWPVGEALTHALSGQWQGGLGPTLTLVSVLGGTVVIALATITLVAAAQDVFSGPMATLIVLGALFSTLVAAPFAPAIVALPITSVLVVWQLSRVGAIPMWLFRMHAAAPIVALVVFVIGLTGALPGADIGPAGILLGLLVVAVLYLYPLSWLAIGWSLLRRRPAAPDDMAGVSPA